MPSLSYRVVNGNDLSLIYFVLSAAISISCSFAGLLNRLHLLLQVLLVVAALFTYISFIFGNCTKKYPIHHVHRRE